MVILLYVILSLADQNIFRSFIGQYLQRTILTLSLLQFEIVLDAVIIIVPTMFFNVCTYRYAVI
jgi:hypothetical protein